MIKNSKKNEILKSVLDKVKTCFYPIIEKYSNK